MGLIVLTTTNPENQPVNHWPEGNSWLMLETVYADLVALNNAAGGGGGAGTVTSVSVASANGFAGTVATATTTPAITLSTTITGILKGNGTALLAASDADITASLITGYVSGAGVISATDSILSAIQKLDGNIAAISSPVTSVFGRTGVVTAQSGDYTTAQVTESGNLYFTNARAIASTLTGYSSGAGTISAADTILQAIQKLNGNTVGSQGDTGALSYGGMTAASGTTVDIGPLKGWVIDNETNPLVPVPVYIDYPGALGVTVPTIGSGQISYLLMFPDGLGSATLVWQNSFPTSAQRKTHIYASKCSHPNLVSLGVVGNETDYITSRLGLTRDFFQSVNYVNNGIHATAVTPGMTFATSTGKIIGNGINFYLDRTNPNEISRAGTDPTSFFYRTQLGGATGAVTAIDPANYDVGGVITAIPGGTNVSTIQYIYAVPFNGAIGFVAQYGQTLYSTLASARAAVGKENPVVFHNLVRDAILIGFICLRKTTTDLTDLTFAEFFKADYFGQAGGGTGGTSVSTLQQAYNNSGAVDPQILTSTANDGVKIRRGSAADTDFILVGQNGAGSATFSVSGAGAIVATQDINPLSIGGTGVAGSKEIRATSGVGAGAEFIKFTYGSNGASEAMRIDGGGRLIIGSTTPVSTEMLSVQKNQNAATSATIRNTTAGTASAAYTAYGSDVANLVIGTFSSTFTTANIQEANKAVILSSSGGGMNIGCSFGGVLDLWAAGARRGRFDTLGNFVLGGTAALFGEMLSIQKNSNAFNFAVLSNTTVGTGAASEMFVTADGGGVAIDALSSGYTTSGARVQNTGVVVSNMTGGLNVGTNSASQFSVWTNNVKRWIVDGTDGNLSNTGSTGTAFLDLKAGTTAYAQIRMRAGVAPTSPNDGDLYYIDTNDRLMFRKASLDSEIISASAVTTEVVVSDTTLTVTYNGTTYKILARA